MAELLKGAPVVEALNEKLTRQLAGGKARGVVPTRALVRGGERPDETAYERGAIKRCGKAGVQVLPVTLPGDSDELTVITTLQDLNRDEQIHGVLLFRPLPKYMNDDRVRNTLAPEKDIDGITDASLAGVFTGNDAGTSSEASPGYAPCTAQACMEILDHYGIDPRGKRAVVIGRSLVVGKPAAMMLIGRHATVTVCHTRTVNMPALCREAELLIVSAGRAEIVDKAYLSPGQIVIDVGINVSEDGAISGDVNFAEAGEIVKAVTPVPGGVGTVTTSVLVKHVVDAAEKAADRNG
jgi:methylenetetrahydrofolate dehydrogenase (NADP+)/methenyltetrahydrofolate cyclohydrolase